jgi:hypothetical protein
LPCFDTIHFVNGNLEVQERTYGNTRVSLQEFLELPRKKFLGNMQEFLGNDVFPENFPGKYS